ncbi:hypothetical protein LQZ19_18430 [Treponema primitia]|uniref:hypothetical protein n=1 Tax=Treponema primitia TaxID=88058 RepID=UPI00397FE27E
MFRKNYQKGRTLGESTNNEESLNELSFEEKIKLLSELDKSYLQGYIDKAVIYCRKSKNTRKNKRKSGEVDENK